MFNATLIVASCGSELDWLDALLAREPGLQAVIVEQCTLRRASGRRVSIVSAPRCGREAGSYLLYIIRQWEALPVHLFFMQGDAPRHCRHTHWSDDQREMRFSKSSMRLRRGCVATSAILTRALTPSTSSYRGGLRWRGGRGGDV